MIEPREKKLTPKNQAQPDTHRSEFLQGLMEQANEEGYALKDKGRLLVTMLRVYEGR